MRRIAVCISGEFRHVHHRVPEHQVRHMLGFLSGVDCDVFIHGWHNTSEALILHELQPRAHLFERRPSFSRLIERIRFAEPNIKPGRDEGSLSMFRGWQQCFRLIEPYAAEYSHVLRIRPDLVSELSLRELVEQIDDAGVVEDAIYVPHIFQSKGINDQIAFGPIDKMRIYSDTLTHVTQTLDSEFFNPETALLRNLVAHDVPIAFFRAPYALMREVPIRINTVHERFHSQSAIWWARAEWLPCHRDLSAYFRQKLRAVDDLMKKRVPELLYLRVPADGGGRAVVRTRVVDNDPAVASYSLSRRLGLWRAGGYAIRSRSVEFRDAEFDRQTFILRDADGLTLSEWRMEGGMLRNEMLAVSKRNVATSARAARVPLRLALKMQKWRDRTPRVLRRRASAAAGVDAG